MTSESLNRPNFLLGVGAQKAGTSWLFKYLNTHPDCAMGPIKEMCFFADPIMAIHTKSTVRNRSTKLKQALDISTRQKLGPRAEKRLVALLDAVIIRHRPERYAEAYSRIVQQNPDTRLIGDITPDYAILHPKDVQRMKDHLAGMGYPVKVVMLMRDPVERCFSAARMKDRNKLARNQEAASRFSDDDFMAFATNPGAEARTRYEKTIVALEKSFDPSQIFYGIYEDFFNVAEVKRLCAFLEISFVEPQLDVLANAGTEKKLLPEEQAAQIRAFYADTYVFCRDRFGAERINRLWSR